jgi:hypothetical protein
LPSISSLQANGSSFKIGRIALRHGLYICADTELDYEVDLPPLWIATMLS